MHLTARMNPRTFLPLVLAVAIAPGALSAAEKITYNDQVLPLFKNACLNCHNPDKKKAGLDLSTYQGALAGSDNGKVVESGNPANSLLLKCVKQTDDPKMPPKGDKLSDGDIALIEKWIQGQLLETATGKAIAVSNNVQLAVVSLDRPAGPPPMPLTDLPLEPLVRTKGSNALVALAASPWAPLVAVGGQKQIILYNTDTLQSLGILPFAEGFPAVIRFSRNGQLLLTGGGLGGKSGKVVLYKVETGERTGEVGNEFDQVLGADISPDHAHVALGGPTKVVKIYATKDGKLEQSIKKHTDWITAVTFSPDGRYLASADRSGGIVVWEGASGKEFNTLPGHKLAVTALAFMPGVLASASEDGKISLWDVKEGKEIRSWNAHAGGVEWVDFTPDGRLVSCGRDKLAKVWDQTGKVLLTSEAFDDIALRAVLSHERVVAGDWTGKIRVWNLADTKRLGELTSNPPLIAEGLTAAEQRLQEAKAKLPALQQAEAAADTQAKAAVAAAEGKRKEETAGLESRRQQAQKELDDRKAALPATEAQLAQDRTALETLVKAREAAPEPERAAADAKINEAKAKVAAVEAQVVQARAAAPAQLAALQKKLDEASNAVAEFQKSALKLAPEAGVALTTAQAARQAAEAEIAAATIDQQRWQRAQAYMTVHRARQSLSELTTRLEGLTAAAKEALAPIDKLQSEAAAAEKAATEAAASVKQKADELAKIQSDADATKKMLADSESAARDKAARRKSLEAAVERATAEAAALISTLEARKKEVADLEQSAGNLAAGTPERGVADAKLAGPKADLARQQGNLEAAQASLTAVKALIEPGTAEAVAAEAALTKSRELAQAAAGKVGDALKAHASAQDAAKAATAKLAELRQKAPAVTAEANAAKAKAEQDAGSTAKELETAKVQAERARVEFETRYRSAAAAKPGEPLASK